MYEFSMRALLFAQEIFQYETRANGDLAIGHAVRVALKFHDPLDIAVAVLHDVVEDGPANAWQRLDEELQISPGTEAYTALEALSRKPGERYFDYIERVKANDIARRVKLADLADNLNGCTRTLRIRYLKAQKILERNESSQ